MLCCTFRGGAMGYGVWGFWGGIPVYGVWVMGVLRILRKGTPPPTPHSQRLQKTLVQPDERLPGGLPLIMFSRGPWGSASDNV